jgi:hypothetical protein
VPPSIKRCASACAGPLLIVGAVLIVLHGLAWGGRISTQQIDVLPQWLPTFCFLGKTLAAGHVPAWNPYALAGTPFAADPQSGWTYLPAMFLFSAFSCDRAIRWFIVLQPILAGLGVYAFLRSERLSRAAATAAGLVLAMAVADSYLLLSVPFAGTVAWSALLLAAGSRFMRAASWAARLLWLGAVGIAWGQLADAHMAHGLLMGTAALFVYLVVQLVSEARRGRWRVAALSIGLLLVALPAVNLAVFLPRLPFIHRSSLGLGYLGLQRAASHLVHQAPAPFEVGAASPPTWPLGLATAPGSYLGAVALGLTFAGWRAREHLGLVVGFALYTAACFILSLHWMAERLRSAVVHTGPGQIWLHEPARFRYGALLGITLMVGFGVQAWRTARTFSERALMLAPAVVVFGVLPSITHVTHGRTWFVAVMAVIAAAVLGVTAWRPALLFLVPAVLAAELVTNGFIGHGVGSTPSGIGVDHPQRYVAWGPLRAPDVDAAAYVRPTRIVHRLKEDGGRYISLAFAGFHRERGYLLLQRPQYWGLLADQRSMLFHIPDVQGYNPAQLARFWAFVRAVDPRRIRYNASVFSRSSNPVAQDVLRMDWTVSPTSSEPATPAWTGRRDLVDGQWSLYRLTRTPLASSFERWRVAATPQAALRAVVGRGFDPERAVVVEGGPGAPGSGPRRRTARPVDVRESGAQSATLKVHARLPVVVLIRIPFDSSWHATLDGRPVAVLHADYVDMAVTVPRGTHVLELAYDDQRIGFGLLGSGLSLGSLVVVALVTRRRRRGPPG